MHNVKLIFNKWIFHLLIISCKMENTLYSLSTNVNVHLPQYARFSCAAMKTPAPQVSAGHSRLKR